MQPQHNLLEGTRFENNFNWADQTQIHPIGLAIVIACAIALLFLPRRYAIWPIIVIACFVAHGQRLVLFSLDFTLLRVMVLAGWLRIIARNDVRGFVWHALDRWIILWAVSGTLVFTALRGSVPDLVNRLGVAFDAVGLYFLFRVLVRDWHDFQNAIVGFVVFSVPVLIAFAIENRTGRNMFAFLGGVPEITVIRNGRLRCQGAFAHPILAGCFWASLLPPMVALWWRGAAYRGLAIVGTITTCLIVLLCASSTPVTVVAMGVVGWMLLPFRTHMRRIRWGVVITLAVLHMLMKAPVWHLIARIDFVGGSTSWHRYNVINEAVSHFGEWWALGIRSTTHWDVLDITNHFVLEGLRGGLITLIIFVIGIAVAFRSVGKLWRSCESDRAGLICAWSLGVALFVECMAFVGVSYFGQIIVVWYFLLASIASLSIRATVPETSRRDVRAPSAEAARVQFARLRVPEVQHT